MLSDRTELATALLAGVVGLAGSYAVTGMATEFLGATVTSFVITSTPGSIVTISILYLGKVGHYLAVVSGYALSVMLLSVAVFTGLVTGRRVLDRRLGAILGLAFPFGLVVVLTRSLISASGTLAAIGAFLVLLQLEPISTPKVGTSLGRRDVLTGTATALVLSLAGYVVGERTETDQIEETEQGADESEVQRRLAEASKKQLEFASENNPGLVSQSGYFYTVDIAAVTPDLPSDEWELSISGQVRNEIELSYDELVSKPAEHRFITLRCVGDPLNGALMDNALWTGVPILETIERASPDSECNCVKLRAADDYYQVFPLEALRTGFLAYRMNGEPLPGDYGAPVRALIPGHWGEINVKWLTEIEVLEKEQLGYWEQRGWHGTGPVHTVAKLWEINELEDGGMQIGGHAYAGTRGVERVEVSIDGGDSWQDTVLSAPIDDEDVWRQWKYEWQPSREEVTIVVRAIDGEGEMQPEHRTNPHPEGASGWVTKTIGVDPQ